MLLSFLWPFLSSDTTLAPAYVTIHMEVGLISLQTLSKSSVAFSVKYANSNPVKYTSEPKLKSMCAYFYVIYFYHRNCVLLLPH